MSDVMQELISLLGRGWVSFEFVKKDGSFRMVEGTTRIDLIPEEHRPKPKRGRPRKKNPNQICLFDRTVGEWRSITNESEILSMKEV
jgi:hypothetical protein